MNVASFGEFRAGGGDKIAVLQGGFDGNVSINDPKVEVDAMNKRQEPCSENPLCECQDRKHLPGFPTRGKETHVTLDTPGRNFERGSFQRGPRSCRVADFWKLVLLSQSATSTF